MFQLIKLIFWLCVSVIIAYFMTDIKVGGKTIKENIDQFLHSDSGKEAKEKIHEWIDDKLGNDSNKKEAPAAPQKPTSTVQTIVQEALNQATEKQKPADKPKTHEEDISSKDEKALKKVLKAHD